MHRSSERQKLVSRRAAVLGGAKLVLFSALAGRMYYLQVLDADRYKTMAEDNRISIRLLPPPRGKIVDRFGDPMADNEQNYRVIITAEDTNGDPAGTLDSLAQIIPISDKERARILREIKRKRSFVPVTVRENLSWDEVARIEVNTPNLPGTHIDVGQTRFYPEGMAAAHVLGYVAAVSERDEKDDPLLQLPGFRIGKSGVERIHDLALRGEGGTTRVEVNALGRVIQEVERNEGQPGSEIALSIDFGLQKYVSKRLITNYNGQDIPESASVVVMDVHTGELLAMKSSPGFDPNAFNRGLSQTEWRDLVNNERSPLINKSIAGQYSPGSTFKMLVALAALDRGVITPETKFFCGGHVSLGNARFHCWKRGGHGHMNLKESLKHSCDVYYYEIAKKIGINRIAEMARKFGLGDNLGFEMNGTKSGLVPTRDWKLAEIGAPWQQGETLISGIGQGYLLTTPLQLAVMTARLVNGGFAVKPRLTRQVTDASGATLVQPEPFESIGVNSYHLKLMKDAMGSVTNEIGGTAFRSRITEDGLEMGGKTGTVQVRRITKAERETTGVIPNEELPWRQRDHALFVGFAPFHAPRYAIAVVVEHGGSGSKAAAPIARDVLLEAQRRNSARVVPPPGETVLNTVPSVQDLFGEG